MSISRSVPIMPAAPVAESRMTRQPVGAARSMAAPISVSRSLLCSSTGVILSLHWGVLDVSRVRFSVDLVNDRDIFRPWTFVWIVQLHEHFDFLSLLNGVTPFPLHG